MLGNIKYAIRETYIGFMREKQKIKIRWNRMWEIKGYNRNDSQTID